MAAILGLTSAEDFASSRFKNIRRQVFYFYPNGAAPLIGLLSLLPEEDTNDPEFYWNEKRLNPQTTATAAANSDGPFTATGTDTNKTTAGWSDSAGTVIRVKTPSNGTDILRVGHVVQIKSVPTTGSAIDIQGVVTEKVSGVTTKFEIRLLHAVSNALNTTAANGLEIWVIGNAFEEGATGASGNIWNPPVEVGNYTQIFRTEFSISGTALKTSAKYDETGPYKDKAKEHSIYHMTEMEKAFLFNQYKTKVTNATTNLTRRTTMGVIGFLMLFEAGTTYGNTAATQDSDDNKRIITNSSGQMSMELYDHYLERVFRVTNNTSNEKLVFCGSGFLSVINSMYRGQACLTTDLSGADTFGLNIVKHVTPFGTVYYKSHPLFGANPRERYNALFLDVPNMKYRFVQGRDTELLTERQPNNADYRMDEWFTEAGEELRMPESFMYLQNVREVIPG